MVELAIVLPILLLVLFGIIETSLILYNKAIITHASRVGARAGIVFRSDPATGAYSPMAEAEIAADHVNPYLDNYLVTFSAATASTTVVPAQCPARDASPPRQITVTVTYPYTFLLLPNLDLSGSGFLAGLNPLNLRSEAVMSCE